MGQETIRPVGPITGRAPMEWRILLP